MKLLAVLFVLVTYDGGKLMKTEAMFPSMQECYEALFKIRHEKEAGKGDGISFTAFCAHRKGN